MIHWSFVSLNEYKIKSSFFPELLVLHVTVLAQIVDAAHIDASTFYG